MASLTCRNDLALEIPVTASAFAKERVCQGGQ